MALAVSLQHIALLTVELGDRAAMSAKAVTCCIRIFEVLEGTDILNADILDMLVIKKLITEAPKGTDEFWHTDLEKMLVDIVSDKLLRSCVNQGEYKTIFTQAFKDFYIDESQLFRYARRRNAKAKVLEQIDKSLLRTE